MEGGEYSRLLSLWKVEAVEAAATSTGSVSASIKSTEKLNFLLKSM